MIPLTSTDIVYGIVCLTIATLIARRGYRKGSLSYTGAIGAFIVGSVSLFSHLLFGTLLLVFYFTGSYFTKYKTTIKQRYDNDIVDHPDAPSVSSDQRGGGGGNRGIVQVFATAGWGVLFALVHLYSYYTDRTYHTYIHSLPYLAVSFRSSSSLWNIDESSTRLNVIMLAYLGNFACVCGDTWASELGILSTDVPRLITSFLCSLRVPRGTNGGVSLWGCVCSFVGGLCMGFTVWFVQSLGSIVYTYTSTKDTISVLPFPVDQWYLLPLGGIVGLLGSVIDSILGATIQRTWYYPSTGKVSCYPPSTDSQDSRIYIRLPYSTDMLDSGTWVKKQDEYTGSNKKIPYVIITGVPVLTNELVNLSSSLITAILTVYLGYLYQRTFLPLP